MKISSRHRRITLSSFSSIHARCKLLRDEFQFECMHQWPCEAIRFDPRVLTFAALSIMSMVVTGTGGACCLGFVWMRRDRCAMQCTESCQQGSVVPVRPSLSLHSTWSSIVSCVGSNNWACGGSRYSRNAIVVKLFELRWPGGFLNANLLLFFKLFFYNLKWDKFSIPS